MENNEYHLYIHLDDGDGASAMAGDGSKKQPSEDKGDAKGALSAAKKLVSYSAIKSTADHLISYKISQVGLTTGAQEYEQRLSTVHSFNSQMLDTGVMLGVGAATGTLPIVAVGLISKGINQLLGIMEKLNTIQNERSLENISISMQNMRAGNVSRR